MKISDLIRKTIIDLCNANTSPKSQITVDGILFLSQQNNVEPLVIKVQEDFRSDYCDDREINYNQNDNFLKGHQAIEPLDYASSKDCLVDQYVVDLSKKNYFTEGKNLSTTCVNKLTQKSSNNVNFCENVRSLKSSLCNPADIKEFSECHICHVQFNEFNEMVKHNEKIHNSYYCLICSKSFTSKSNLDRHSRLHTGYKPYICSVCKRTFTRKDHLTSHQTKHSSISYDANIFNNNADKQTNSQDVNELLYKIKYVKATLNEKTSNQTKEMINKFNLSRKQNLEIDLSCNIPNKNQMCFSSFKNNVFNSKVEYFKEEKPFAHNNTQSSTCSPLNLYGSDARNTQLTISQNSMPGSNIINRETKILKRKHSVPELLNHFIFDKSSIDSDLQFISQNHLNFDIIKQKKTTEFKDLNAGENNIQNEPISLIVEKVEDNICNKFSLCPTLLATSESPQEKQANFNFIATQTCSICSQNFSDFQELESHCVIAHKRNACMYCEKTFAQRANRDRHLCLHTGAKHYICFECGDRFARSDKLKMHRIRVHQVVYERKGKQQDSMKNIPPDPISSDHNINNDFMDDVMDHGSSSSNLFCQPNISLELSNSNSDSINDRKFDKQMIMDEHDSMESDKT